MQTPSIGTTENRPVPARSAGPRETEVTYPMARLIDEISAALGPSPTESRALEQLPVVLARHLTQPGLLSAGQRRTSSERYVRHLVHADRQGRFSVLALAWAADQITPVHGHNAWGVVGVHDGTMENTCYAVQVGGVPRATATTRVATGCIAPVRAGDESAHTLRNPGPVPAYTVHVYGMDLAAEPTGINRYYDV